MQSAPASLPQISLSLGVFLGKCLFVACLSWLLSTPPYFSLLVVARSHISIIAVCGCLAFQWRARSLAMFSFSTTSTGWTPRWSKGSTGCGWTGFLDMQSWTICNDDSRTNVLWHMFVSERRNTRLCSYACQRRFHPRCIDAEEHVNKHLIRWLHETRRAVDLWQSNTVQYRQGETERGGRS